MRTRLAVLALAAGCLATGTSVAQGVDGKPIGQWERNLGKNVARLIVEEGRLHLQITGEKVATVHADYCMTRDRILYGIITSVDCNEEQDEELVDQPFSCRFRVDEGVLTVRDMKMGVLSKQDAATCCGRFRAAPGAAPTILRASTPWIAAPPSVTSPPGWMGYPNSAWPPHGQFR